MSQIQQNSGVVPDTLPWFTESLPGIGGLLKQSPDDFVVEEIPAYKPCGDGEHLFVWIEKRDLAAEDMVSRIARILGIPCTEIGSAGLKDRRAVTRQFLSLPARCEPRLRDIEAPDLRILSANRHRNKLRTGHLRGNQFEIVVRRTVPDALPRASAIAAVIRERGFPNFYGQQRFGHGGSTWELGVDLLTGRRQPHSIPPKRRRFLLRLALSALQSGLFNDVLAERLRDGRLHTVEAGDVMQVVATGGCFVVDDVAHELERFKRRETVVTGPLFGPAMKQPAGRPLAREQEALERHRMRIETFDTYRKLVPGARRPALIWPSDLAVEPAADGLRFRFTLSSGAYATSLLREFMKCDTAERDSGEDV